MSAETDEAVRRVTAALKAFDGMPTEHIEELLAIGSNVVGIVMNANRKREQRDELRERLQELVEATQYSPQGVRALQQIALSKVLLERIKP